eukprot:CAMPEP_0117576438 /NCGR_PEP_ID=MMETSP0784-20121206/62797_1 /TAXON_ID=39447 /ORGANISM="" /LENGTH=370 /DNA_ID=CAMNT_0005375689 /DNA_START=179 /DNA_END=1291 /DNA_ORIENTATION=+
MGRTTFAVSSACAADGDLTMKQLLDMLERAGLGDTLRKPKLRGKAETVRHRLQGQLARKQAHEGHGEDLCDAPALPTMEAQEDAAREAQMALMNEIAPKKTGQSKRAYRQAAERQIEEVSGTDGGARQATYKQGDHKVAFMRACGYTTWDSAREPGLCAHTVACRASRLRSSNDLDLLALLAAEKRLCMRVQGRCLLRVFQQWHSVTEDLRAGRVHSGILRKILCSWAKGVARERDARIRGRANMCAALAFASARVHPRWLQRTLQAWSEYARSATAATAMFVGPFSTRVRCQKLLQVLRSWAEEARTEAGTAALFGSATMPNVDVGLDDPFEPPIVEYWGTKPSLAPAALVFSWHPCSMAPVAFNFLPA